MLEKIGRFYAWNLWWCPPAKRWCRAHARGVGMLFIATLIINILTWRQQWNFWMKVQTRWMSKLLGEDITPSHYMGKVDGQTILTGDSTCIAHRQFNCLTCTINQIDVDQKARDQQEV
jgi:hypothetical protein